MTTHGENEFWKCLRCSRFLLHNTSTVKRYHNVQCLSTSFAKTARFTNTIPHTEQGFEKVCFPGLAIKLTQFSDSDIAKSCMQLKTLTPIRKKRPYTTNAHLIEITDLQPRRSNLTAKEKLKAMANGIAKVKINGKDDDDNGDKNFTPSLRKSKKRKTKIKKTKDCNSDQPRPYRSTSTHSYLSREFNPQFPKSLQTKTYRPNRFKYRYDYKPKPLEMGACDICGKVIGLRYLKNHKKTFHSQKELSPGKSLCVVCKRGFAHRDALKHHFVRLHMATSPYGCKMEGCDFAAGQYYHLERHVRLHIMGGKRIKCSDCGNTYISRHNCKTNPQTKRNINVRKSTSRIGVQRLKLDDLLNIPHSQPKPDVINVELERVHFVDTIIKTEHDSVHIKGEQLDPTYEPLEFTGDIKMENEPCENYSVDTNSNSDADGNFKEDEDETPETMSESTIRSVIRKQILSWNSKIMSAGYLTDFIRNDPVYQKLQKEEPEFCELLLRGCRMREYKTGATAPPKYQCSVCSEQFGRVWALDKHVNSKACQTKVSVDLKNGKVNSQSQPRTNTLGSTTTSSDICETVTKKTNVVSLICLSCGYQSTSPKDLKHHMKTALNHSNKYLKDRKHQCTRCGGWFKSLEQLNDHVDRIHLAKRDFKCEFCPKAFTGERNLKNHVDNVHSNKQLYICKICNRKFRVLEYCQKHEKTCESQETRPKCHVCGDTFQNKTSLRRHVLRFHTTDSFNVTKLQSNLNSTSKQNGSNNESSKVLSTDRNTNSTDQQINNTNETEMDTESSLILGI